MRLNKINTVIASQQIFQLNYEQLCVDANVLYVRSDIPEQIVLDLRDKCLVLSIKTSIRHIILKTGVTNYVHKTSRPLGPQANEIVYLFKKEIPCKKNTNFPRSKETLSSLYATNTFNLISVPLHVPAAKWTFRVRCHTFTQFGDRLAMGLYHEPCLLSLYLYDSPL